MARFIHSSIELTDYSLDQWTSIRVLSLIEGIMLLLEMNPEYKDAIGFNLSSTSDEIGRWAGFIARELTEEEAASNKIKPIRFIQMADACRLSVSDRVREAFIRNQRQESNFDKHQNIGQEKDPSITGEKEGNRKLESLYKIIFAIAVEKYRYNTDSEKSEVPGKIADTLALQGLSLSDRTIRDHLREAARVVGKRK